MDNKDFNLPNDLSQMMNLFNFITKDLVKLGTVVNTNLIEESTKCVSNIANNISETMSKIASLSQFESELHNIAYEYGKTSDIELLEQFKSKAKEYYNIKVNSEKSENNN